MSVHELLRATMFYGFVILIFLGLTSLAVNHLRNKRTKFLGKYLDENRHDRNVYYKAEREFAKEEASGCIYSAVGGIVALLIIVSVYYAFCK